MRERESERETGRGRAKKRARERETSKGERYRERVEQLGVGGEGARDVTCVGKGYGGGRTKWSSTRWHATWCRGVSVGKNERVSTCSGRAKPSRNSSRSGSGGVPDMRGGRGGVEDEVDVLLGREVERLVDGHTCPLA